MLKIIVLSLAAFFGSPSSAPADSCSAAPIRAQAEPEIFPREDAYCAGWGVRCFVPSTCCSGVCLNHYCK